jgi:hypothetical protein
MKKNFGLNKIGFVLIGVASIFLASIVEISAQAGRVPVQDEAEDFTWWYISLAVLSAGLIGAIAWLIKKKNAEKAQQVKVQKAQQKRDVRDTSALDMDKEMEWLRKNQNIIDKNRKKRAAKSKAANNLASTENAANDNGAAGAPKQNIEPHDLPVFAFRQLQSAKSFSPLPISNDEALLSAIEQAHDEYEEDEEIRDLSIRILTAFKTRNSIEALSQVALYDLSSGLRSKAVLTLTEFDHESVFEPILLACADPTREVRAAAARGLTRLSFDRADAWARIAETGEEGRIRQCARAAIESGFVERSFDRLVHQDRQYAYEAFVLLSLLIKARELEPIFEALENHKNMNVRLAILHLIKVTKEQNALDELSKLLEDKKLPEKLRVEANKIIEEVSLVAA